MDHCICSSWKQSTETNGTEIYRAHQRTDKRNIHAMLADNGIHMVKSKVCEKTGIRLAK